MDVLPLTNYIAAIRSGEVAGSGGGGREPGLGSLRPCDSFAFPAGASQGQQDTGDTHQRNSWYILSND